MQSFAENRKGQRDKGTDREQKIRVKGQRKKKQGKKTRRENAPFARLCCKQQRTNKKVHKQGAKAKAKAKAQGAKEKE